MQDQNKKLLARIDFLLQEPQERIFKKKNLTEENKQKILSLKDSHKGKRCFVVGSSPSLNMVDLTKLNNEFVFTVNRGYMLKEKGLLHTKFHVVSDRYTFKDSNTNVELLTDFTDNLFCYAGMECPVFNINTFYFDYVLAQLNKETVFQTDLLKPLIAYQSVIHFAIQIACYLGFSKIYLLGVDLDFANIKGHAYVETQGEKERERTASILNTKKMIIGLEKCTEWLQQHNVEIYNASPVGAVNCMARVIYNDIFNRF